MGELHNENGLHCIFAIRVLREIYEDGVAADVWVLGRVDPCEVLNFNLDMTARGGYRSDGERALHVLAGRRVVAVDQVDLDNILAVDI